jgi:hypothetical protein
MFLHSGKHMSISDDTPKLRRATEREKITLYFDKDVGELYRIGKQNGWDVCEMVRRAASEILRQNTDTLVKRAKST